MYKLLLSLRYFRSRFLTFASFLAITFGVAMLVIVLSVMGGYLEQIKENLRGQEADLRIRGPGQFPIRQFPELDSVVRSVDNVSATAAFVEQLAVYRTIVSFRPFRLQAVDPTQHARVSGLAKFTLRPSELDEIIADYIDRGLEEDDGDDGAGEDAIDGAGEDAMDGAGDVAVDGREDSSGDGADSNSTEPETPWVSDRVRASKATQAVHELIARRADPGGPGHLTEDEIDRLFSREWRSETIRRFGGEERLQSFDGQVPAGAIVGIQMLIERQLSLGDVISVVTVETDGRRQDVLDKDFVIVGAMITGDFEQDSQAILTELSVVRNWLPLFDERDNEYRYQGVRVALEDGRRIEETRAAVAAALRREFPGNLYDVETWEELRKNFLRAVLIEKFLVYFLVLILVVFTGSMILLMLLLTVIEKTRDVGVLLSLGARPSE